jgi:hypothetical protein
VTELMQLVHAFVEGTVKVLPAILAAYYAYRLWYQKLIQDRADSIVKGCLILQHFCHSLDRQFVDDPDKPNSVAIESINHHLDSILSTTTVSAQFGDVLETYHLWRKRVYFPLSVDAETDVARRRALLKRCADSCGAIVSQLRGSAPAELAKLKLSAL